MSLGRYMKKKEARYGTYYNPYTGYQQDSVNSLLGALPSYQSNYDSSIARGQTNSRANLMGAFGALNAGSNALYNYNQGRVNQDYYDNRRSNQYYDSFVDTPKQTFGYNDPHVGFGGDVTTVGRYGGIPVYKTKPKAVHGGVVGNGTILDNRPYNKTYSKNFPQISNYWDSSTAIHNNKQIGRSKDVGYSSVHGQPLAVQGVERSAYSTGFKPNYSNNPKYNLAYY